MHKYTFKMFKKRFPDYLVKSGRMRKEHADKLKGNKNLLGYHHTEESRKNISLGLLGNKNFLNKHHTEESRKKISQAGKLRYKIAKRNRNKLKTVS